MPQARLIPSPQRQTHDPQVASLSQATTERWDNTWRSTITPASTAPSSLTIPITVASVALLALFALRQWEILAALVTAAGFAIGGVRLAHRPWLLGVCLFGVGMALVWGLLALPMGWAWWGFGD